MSRNNKKRVSESGGNKLPLAGLVAAALAIGLGWYYWHGRPEGSLTSGVEVDGNGQPKRKADKFGVEPGRHAATPPEAFLREIPWESFKLSDDGTLRVSMESRKWCTLGDLDVIALDGKASENPKFLLTVEPLNPEDAGFQPMVRSLTSNDFQKGFRTTFKLPHLNKTMQAGLFLCKDSGNQGRCNTDAKEAIDINRMLSNDSEGMKKNNHFRSPDRIYFFQYLYLEGDHSVRAFQNPDVPDVSFDAVSARLKTASGNAKDEDMLQNALGRAKRFQQTLRSLPLEQGGGYARIVLPMMDGDHTHCPKVVVNPVLQGGPQHRPE
jgi:hypothetical protein